MTVELTWHSDLHRPRISNYSFNQTQGLDTSDVGNGLKVTRLRKGLRRVIKAIFVVNESDAESFETSLNDTYLGKWFLLSVRLPRAQTVQECEVKFIADPRDTCRPFKGSSSRWEYSAELELRNMPELDKDVYQNVMDLGVTLTYSMSLLKALEKTVNG